MLKVLTAEQIHEVDRLTTERYGIPSILLMENAAHAVARVITKKFGGSVTGRRFVILCGIGNNGGDGAALARILWMQGGNCFVYLFGKVADTSGDAKINFETLKKFYDSPENNGSNENCLLFFENADVSHSGFIRPEDDLVVDALFGTGLSRPLEGQIGDLVNSLVRSKSTLKPYFLSVDLPSGLQSDSQEIFGSVFPADLTVTFSAPKLANIFPPATSLNGELTIANIGSPPELIIEQPSQLYFAEIADAQKWIQSTQFSLSSYKNKRGHALIIAGSESYSGAAVLAGNAAMRSGVGLVTLGVSTSVKSEIAARTLPEIIVRPIAEKDDGLFTETAFTENAEMIISADAIAVGCGLSTKDNGVQNLVREIVATRTNPVIIDAGALSIFSPFHANINGPHVSTRDPADNSSPRASLILTPHEGEFKRLLGRDDKAAIGDRVAAVRGFATRNNVILVLKGERILIGAPDGKVVVNPTGNSGLGKAGNGDTLTGILVGFVAQAVKLEIDIFDTVVAAVYLAGMAGDIAEKKYGKRVLTASDVRECLMDAFSEIQGPKREQLECQLNT